MGALRDLVEQHYRNVAAADIEADGEIFTDDVVTIDPGAGRIDGIDAFKAFEAGFHKAFPDGRMDVKTLVESGDTVMTEGVFLGTHTGPLVGPGGEIPATGRKLELPFSDVFKARGGRLAEHHIYYDQVTFMVQLGLMPAPSQA